LAPELPTSDQENEKDETEHDREVSVYSDSGGDSSGDSSAREDASKEKRKRQRQRSPSPSQSGKSSKRKTSSDGSSSYTRSSSSFRSVTHAKNAIMLNPQMTKCEVGKTGFVFRVFGKLEEIADALKDGSDVLEEATEEAKVALEEARDAVNSSSHSGTSKDGLALEGAILGLEAGVAERGWRDGVLDMVSELASIGREKVPYGAVMVHVKGALRKDYHCALKESIVTRSNGKSVGEMEQEYGFSIGQLGRLQLRVKHLFHSSGLTKELQKAGKLGKDGLGKKYWTSIKELFRENKTIRSRVEQMLVDVAETQQIQL
jgi:hypothetical protein